MITIILNKNMKILCDKKPYFAARWTNLMKLSILKSALSKALGIRYPVVCIFDLYNNYQILQHLQLGLTVKNS